MAASKNEIYRWLKEAPPDTLFTIIIMDTFDCDDYPVYCASEEKCIARIKSPYKHERVMECYDHSMDLKNQFNEHRAWHVPNLLKETEDPHLPVS